MALRRELLLVGLVLCACGSRREGGDAGSTEDAGPSSDAGSSSDGGVDAGAATIAAALACGLPHGLIGVTRAGELQAHELDQSRFPDALCNDGSPPVLYFRPYAGEENRNRWVISLRGGGGCGSAASCAARWCSCATTNRCPSASETTNFMLENMSGGGARSADVGGVLARGAMNPLGNYNQVQFIYCSSDAWRGAARAVEMNTTHPITGQPFTFSMHFMGTRVLDADLAMLRRDGVPALSYTLDGAARALPDLDEAETVVVAGDSAGGAGVIFNLDSIAALLRANHPGCDGGAGCGPDVVGIIDAVVGPEYSRLDFSASAGADAGITTWDAYVGVLSRTAAATTGRGDESCERAHADAGVCSDSTHVVRHHVTTPFFVRMALLDALISRNYEALGIADPVLGPLRLNDAGVPLTFARVLQPELTRFPLLPTTAEEGAQMTKAPGVFAPSCATHDTIHTNGEVYGVSITPDGGQPLFFFDVFGAWRDGGAPTAVISRDPMRADTVCP